MRILGLMLTTVFLYVAAASAATIDLNDGRVVQGDIVKQDEKSLQVNVDGVTMTYYADEIKDVDGKSFAAPQAVQTVNPVTPPVPQAGNTEPQEAVNPPAGDASSASTADAIDPEKKALILKFIDVFGTRQALNNNFALMLSQIEKEKPDEAQKIRDRVKIDEIIERLLPIYDRNFSTEDLKAFIAFYGSAEGQKLIVTIPELMKESVKESVKYMEEKFPEVNQGK